MITPKELLEKSEKLFYRVVTSVLNEQNIFPLILPSNKKLSGTNFNELKAAIIPLYQHSKEVKGKGYTVDWKEKLIDGTRQKLPSKIFFETPEDFFFYTKKEKEYLKVKQAFETLITDFPELTEWAKNNTAFLLSEFEEMPGLIKVCKYFKENKPPHDLYLRELPIEVHSKFIENNTTALKKLLDVILPAAWIDITTNDFLGRYQVKKPNVYAQIRVLDEALKSAVGFDELALTIDDSASLKWQPEKVFIIENKACFLSFPKVKNAIAIFGEGFKSRVTKHIPWLADAELFCWFDLDAAGFEMLNAIRQYYPHSKSIFMDVETFEKFSRFKDMVPFRKLQLAYLEKPETELYQFLQSQNIRLEQERITQEYIITILQALFGEN